MIAAMALLLLVQAESFADRFNAGLRHFQQGQYRDAAPLLERAVEAQPKDFNARYVYGATLSALGLGDDALRQWRAAIDLRPDHGKLLQIMAVEYAKGGYYRQAARSAERALALQSADANLFLIAIKACQDAGDHAKALATAQRMVEAFPGSSRAEFEYGFELHRNGRPEEALPFIQRSMEAADAHEEPFYFYGELMVKDRRYESALGPLRRAVEIRRDYMAAWVMLARALMGLSRLDEAKTELERAIAINPKHPQPHLLLSQIYFRQGDEVRALEEKERSLRLRREDPGALESRPSRAFPGERP